MFKSWVWVFQNWDLTSASRPETNVWETPCFETRCVSNSPAVSCSVAVLYVGTKIACLYSLSPMTRTASNSDLEEGSSVNKSNLTTFQQRFGIGSGCRGAWVGVFDGLFDWQLRRWRTKRRIVAYILDQLWLWDAEKYVLSDPSSPGPWKYQSTSTRISPCGT